MQKNNKYIDIDQIERYDELPEQNYEIYQIWYTANGDGKNNDWSVCSTWLIYKNKFYLLNILRKKLQYKQL